MSFAGSGTVTDNYREQILNNPASYSATKDQVSDDMFTNEFIPGSPTRPSRGTDQTAYSSPDYRFDSWIIAMRQGGKQA